MQPTKRQKESKPLKNKNTRDTNDSKRESASENLPDEAISLNPLSVEDALRGLLDTESPDRHSSSEKGKKPAVRK